MQQVTNIGNWIIHYDSNKKFLFLDHPYTDFNNITIHQRYIYSGIDNDSFDKLIDNLLEIKKKLL